MYAFFFDGNRILEKEMSIDQSWSGGPSCAGNKLTPGLRICRGLSRITFWILR